MGAADSGRAGITITTAATQVTRKRFRFAHAAYRAWSSRIGPCILLMLPQLDQDLEQRAVSLEPADDGWRVGPEVMPVSVTLSGGSGRENARRPVLGRLGELGACPLLPVTEDSDEGGAGDADVGVR